jgi:hypothetical protein
MAKTGTRLGSSLVRQRRGSNRQNQRIESGSEEPHLIGDVGRLLVAIPGGR